jgi:hypothetical protein
MFDSIVSAIGSIAPKPDPNRSRGGYAPRSQRARSALAASRQSADSFAQQQFQAQEKRSAAAAEKAKAQAGNTGRGLFGRISNAITSTPTEGDNAGFADGGLVKKLAASQQCGVVGSLYGKNMKK